MPSPDRGDVWMVDLGLVGKVRPCLVLSVPTGPRDRVLVTLIPHTTSVQGTQFEVPIRVRFLKPGAFDAQQVLTISRAKLIRRRGNLHPVQLAEVEEAVRRWLGLATTT